jgi:type II secretory pathway component PulC
MTPAFPSFSGFWRWLAIVTSGACVAFAVGGTWAWQRLPRVTRAAPAAALVPQAEREALTGDLWRVFRARENRAVPLPAATEKAFRLAGTFFIEASDGTQERKAILDETRTRRQYIVAEGNSVSNALVERIYYDHVVVRTGSATEEIWLDFASHRGEAPGAGGATQDMAAVVGSAETNRFGFRKQEGRWEFKRPAVLQYYQELLDDPDRMVKVFDSLKPVYGDNRRISGYVVGMEGEDDFFKAVGLQNGDVVRRVNTLPMTSRRRAEYFIGEFVRDRMNVVVLDIERDGTPSKLIYEVQP